jgi:hypothetical protein
MKVFTCTDHQGHYVGVSSVIVAHDDSSARKLLADELINQHLSPLDFTLVEVDTTKEIAIILQNGDC